MPQVVTEFLKNISVNSGFINDEFSHAILAHPELAKIELPDEFVASFNNKYLTEESAKANPNIKNHFVFTALNPIDSKLEEIMNEMGFTDADKEEVKKEKSTYKKNELVLKKVKAMSSKNTSEQDKEKFNEEIKRLNDIIVKKEAEKETAIKEVNNRWVTQLSQSTLTSMIKSQPLYTTDTLETDDVAALAHRKLEKALNEKKASMVFDDKTNTFKLVQKDNPDLEYFEDGKKITAESFLQKTLADAKLLKTTPTAPASTERKQMHIPDPVSRRGSGDKTPLQNRIQSSVEDDLLNLKNAESIG